VRNIPNAMKTVLDEPVKFTRFTKSRALNSGIFSELCEEMVVVPKH
jgi:hypothetical protein